MPAMEATVRWQRDHWPLYMVLGVGLWLAATPYMGIDHDARLYVLMAVRHLTPTAYVRDPWFAWGSQDDWSIYSPLLAVMLETFGVQLGALLATMMQGVLFVLAVAALCRSWLRGPAALLAFFLLISVPLYYSPHGMLTVTEGFVTARGLGVSLSMIGLAFLRSRPFWALLLHLVAIGMHPIMGLGPALASLLLIFRYRTSVVLFMTGVLGLAIMFAMAAGGVIPLLDGEWYGYVKPAVLVFITPWLHDEFARLALVFLALGLGARFGTRKARPLYLVASVIGLGGFFVSALAGALPVLIVLQAQIWRVFWLCLVLAMVAVADLTVRHVLRRSAPRRWLWLGVISSLVLLEVIGDEVPVLAVALFVTCLTLMPRMQPSFDRLAANLAARRSWVLAFLFTLALLLLPGFLVSLELSASSVSGASAWPVVVEGVFRSGAFGLLALSIFFCLRYSLKSLPLLLACVTLFCVSGYWDARSQELKDQEALYTVDGRMNPFPKFIKRGDVVYWHQHPERVWMQLGTAGYASTTHCTGLVFSRDRTALIAERMVAVAARSMDEHDYSTAVREGALRDRALAIARPVGDTNVRVLAGYESMTAATDSGLLRMCQDPALDWIVDSRKVEGKYAARHVEKLGGRTQELYLYDCAAFRK